MTRSSLSLSLLLLIQFAASIGIAQETFIADVAATSGAAATNGNVTLAVWRGYGADDGCIAGRYFDNTSALPSGDRFLVRCGPGMGDPKAAVGSSESLVLWGDASGLYAQRIDFEGMMIGSPVKVASSVITDPPEYRAAGAGDDFLVVWGSNANLPMLTVMAIRQGVIEPPYAVPAVQGRNDPAIYPRVVSNGRSFFVTYSRVQSLCGPNCSYWASGARFGLDGKPLDLTSFDVVPSPHINAVQHSPVSSGGSYFAMTSWRVQGAPSWQLTLSVINDSGPVAAQYQVAQHLPRRPQRAVEAIGNQLFVLEEVREYMQPSWLTLQEITTDGRRIGPTRGFSSTFYITDCSMAGKLLFYHAPGDAPGGSKLMMRHVDTLPALPPVPEAPSNLRVVRWLSATQILLSWGDESARELGFLIEQTSQNLSYSNALPANTRETVVTVTAGTSTTLRVAAWNASGESFSQPVTATPTFPRGDANGDGQVTVADIFRIIDGTFMHGAPPFGQPDANGDGLVGIGDVFFLIDFLFRSF